MKKLAELVFIPSPRLGHLIPILEFANRLLAHEDGFSITILVIKLPAADSAADDTKSLAPTNTRIRLIHLPPVNPPPLSEYPKSPEKFMTDFIDAHKSHVKDTIVEHVLSSNSVPLAALVLDMFSMSMVDVGNELGVPSYLFVTSSAGFLGLALYLSTRGKEFEESDIDSVIDVSAYINPVPTRVLPSFCFNKHGGYATFENLGRRSKEMKGIFINTYAELESHAVNSLLDRVPSVYTVGPVIDLAGEIQQAEGHGTQRDEIMRWLDDQPLSSVVFLCFGSIGLGSFNDAQVKEIAVGLEQSGRRFLWSLRKPPPQGTFAVPSDYTCADEILPHGFLERTKGKGIVCGWAPQKEILAHSSVGGFLSHCGWNSILESLWFGVPIVTWPIYAEQQINAFQMVKDLGLAVEMKLDYKRGTDELVLADEIARAVGRVMDGDSEVSRRVKEASEKARSALMNGGSSSAAYQRLIEDVLGNKP